MGYYQYCKECGKEENKEDGKEDAKEEDMKDCSRCKQKLSIEQFNKSKTGYGGYANYCRACTKEKKKEYSSKMKNLEKQEIKDKICVECKINKNVDKFLKKTDSKDGYSNKCKDCIKQIDIVRRNSKIT